MIENQINKSDEIKIRETIERLRKSGDKQAANLIEWLAEGWRDAISDLKHQVITEMRWAIQGLEEIDPEQAKKHMKLLEERNKQKS